MAGAADFSIAFHFFAFRLLDRRLLKHVWWRETGLRKVCILLDRQQLGTQMTIYVDLVDQLFDSLLKLSEGRLLNKLET